MSNQKGGKRKESKHERILRQAREAAEIKDTITVETKDHSENAAIKDQVVEAASKHRPDGETTGEHKTKKRKFLKDDSHDSSRDKSERDAEAVQRIENRDDRPVDGNEGELDGLLALSKPTQPSATPVTGAKKEALLREVIPVWMKTPIDIQECFDAAQDQVDSDSEKWE